MATLDRSTFVGGSVALAAATGTVANAQSTDFGKPHPPIVAENDPEIVVVRTTLQRPDATIGAYVAMPATIKATTPGIVMSAHIWGVDAQYRDLARRFAKLGYITIAPGFPIASILPTVMVSDRCGTARPDVHANDRRRHGDGRFGRRTRLISATCAAREGRPVRQLVAEADSRFKRCPATPATPPRRGALWVRAQRFQGDRTANRPRRSLGQRGSRLP